MTTKKKEKRQVFIGWSAIDENRMLGYGDNRIETIGKKLRAKKRDRWSSGKRLSTKLEHPVVCSQGMHAWRSLADLDSSNFSHRDIYRIVLIEGEISMNSNKVAGLFRTVLMEFDKTTLRRQFTEFCKKNAENNNFPLFRRDRLDLFEKKLFKEHIMDIID